MKLRYLFKLPCRKCLYRLRLVHIIRNPCPGVCSISNIEKGGGY